MSTYTLAVRDCEVCDKKEGLLRCSGCHLVWYCGRDHQVADRDEHKRACGSVKKARAAYEREEHKLHNMPDEGESGYGPDIFVKGAGRFWGILETRPYMQERHQLVDQVLLNFGVANNGNTRPHAPRVDAVNVALDHLLDMIRLSRKDNMGVRDIIPGLFLTLGRDQEAYDFMKWWGTTAESMDFDWSNMNQGFLDIKGADALEVPVKSWTADAVLPTLNHMAAVTLIKVRVLLDLQTVQNARRAFTGSAPNEITDLTRGNLVGSIVESRPDILSMDIEEIARLIETIKDQIRQLYKSTDMHNSYFWRLLLGSSDAADSDMPASYALGSEDEAHLAIGYSCTSWLGTPGATETLKVLKETT